MAGRGIEVTGGGVGGLNVGVDERHTGACDGGSGAAGLGGTSRVRSKTGAGCAGGAVAAREKPPVERGIAIGSGTAAIGVMGVGGIETRGLVHTGLPAGATCATDATGATGATGATAAIGAAMAMMPPHTEQRARTPTVGTLDGSTRNTDRHSGHETFTTPPPRLPRRARVAAVNHHPPLRRHDGRW